MLLAPRHATIAQSGLVRLFGEDVSYGGADG
jgi:hypothetical protein